MAYCLRFSKNRRPSMQTAFVPFFEMTFVLDVLCKSVQKQAFSEYKILSGGNATGLSDKLLSLISFLDEIGLIRITD